MARAKVQQGSQLAQAGDMLVAISAFEEALELDPQIDLDTETETTETDPETAAQQ
jgi:hypothetical protein